MEDIKVSVIMPVYNSEEYLKVAIESVLAQKIESMELLLVNDGSTDKSGEICDSYKEDKRVRVFHKENEGICATRNYAIRQSQGKYLVFIDNDDELMPDVLVSNYNLAEKYGADVVKYGCSIEESFQNGYIDKRINAFMEERIFTNKDAAKYYEIAEKERYFSYIWNGMYRREWWINNELNFDDSVKCGFEDRILNYSIFRLARVQVLNPEIGYKYYQRFEHSTFKKFNRNMLYSCLLSAEKEYDLFEYMEKNDEFQSDWVKRSVEYLIEFLVLLSRNDNDLTKEEIREFMIKLRKSKVFAEIQQKDLTASLTLTKREVVKLFVKEKYQLLYSISRIYTKFIFIKKRLKK